MTLLPDWQQIIRKAWSVKFMVLAALLSGCEAAVSILQPAIAESLPPGVFASLAGLVTAGGMLSCHHKLVRAAFSINLNAPNNTANPQPW